MDNIIKVRPDDDSPYSDDVITFNVGGTRFQTRMSTLQRVPNCKLTKLAHQIRASTENGEQHFVDRDPEYFSRVLDVCRGGRLHIHSHLCWQRLHDEVAFWGLDFRDHLAPCCAPRVENTDEKRRLANWIEAEFRSEADDAVQQRVRVVRAARSGWWGAAACTRLRAAVWSTTEHPTYSRAAKVWAVSMVCIIFMSVILQACITHPQFRYPLDAPRRNLTGLTNRKMYMYATTELQPAIWILEKFCVAIFITELTVRLAVCPNYHQFFRSLYNIIDIVTTVDAIIITMVEGLYENLIANDQLFLFIYVLHAFSTLRVFRLFKFLRHMAGMKVLMMALRASLSEILLLVILLVIGILVFSNLIYFAEFYDAGEEFESVPIGCWWAIVTMTTVGYGDKHPQSAAGYFVGALCAIIGMLMLGVPVPAVASNFNLLNKLYKQRMYLKKYTRDIVPAELEYIDDADQNGDSGNHILLNPVFTAADGVTEHTS